MREINHKRFFIFPIICQNLQDVLFKSVFLGNFMNDQFLLLLLFISFKLGTGRGRVDHEADRDLAHRVRAQAHGGQFRQLRLDRGIDVRQLKVPAPQPALAREALGDGVEAHERDLAVQLAHDLLYSLFQSSLPRCWWRRRLAPVPD